MQLTNSGLKFFLTARHWQIFLLFVGGTMLAQLIFLRQFQAATSLEEMQRVMRPFLAFTLVFAAAFLAWLWSLGEFLATVAPLGLRLSVRRFRLSLIYPIVYMPMFAALLLAQPDPIPGAFAIIFPLHVLAMYCMFYNLYFVAKSLRIAELQRAVMLKNYVGFFFCLWFYPVGIWIVQPRVNAMARSKQI